jgi:hypothetical protein
VHLTGYSKSLSGSVRLLPAGSDFRVQASPRDRSENLQRHAATGRHSTNSVAIMLHRQLLFEFREHGAYLLAKLVHELAQELLHLITL